MPELHQPLKLLLLLSAFLLTASAVFTQEICNNGKDDDGDGLIDLHDPDCQCHFVVKDNLLLNASFESFDHCPVNYTHDLDHNNVTYWDYATYTNVNEAFFYHNLNCNYDSTQIMLTMPPALPLPQGNGFISLTNSAYINPIPEDEIVKSYVGQCLQEPLVKGESYTLSFYAGRFRSWDNYTGAIFPFTVAVFGHKDCNAVPFGKINALGNGCPTNYVGWAFLGSAILTSNGEWVQGKVQLTIPDEINVIEIGADCSILPPIVDLSDSTTFLDYHQYYLDDLHLLPTKEFPFKYIHLKTGSSCNNAHPVLTAPIVNASYQWFRDSIAISGATDSVYQLPAVNETHNYNVAMQTDTGCIISEPYLVTPSKLNAVKTPPDTIMCSGDPPLLLEPPLDGIQYTVNGIPYTSVVINKEGQYNITATDSYGCKKTFKTKVSVYNCSECNVYIPNAFTPNDDGVNDLFRAKLYCNFSEYHFTVFSRWGGKIFESRNINQGWNGSYGGTKMPSGAYVYYLNYKTTTGITKTFKGVFFLIK